MKNFVEPPFSRVLELFRVALMRLYVNGGFNLVKIFYTYFRRRLNVCLSSFILLFLLYRLYYIIGYPCGRKPLNFYVPVGKKSYEITALFDFIFFFCIDWNIYILIWHAELLFFSYHLYFCWFTTALYLWLPAGTVIDLFGLILSIAFHHQERDKSNVLCNKSSRLIRYGKAPWWLPLKQKKNRVVTGNCNQFCCYLWRYHNFQHLS